MPEQNFHTVAPPAEENEEMTAKRILADLSLNQARKGIEAQAHIYGLRAEVYLC